MNENNFNNNDQNQTDAYYNTGMNENTTGSGTVSQDSYSTASEPSGNTYYNTDPPASWRNDSDTWHDQSDIESGTFTHHPETSAPEFTQTQQDFTPSQPESPTSPEYGGAAVFSGSGEAEVDYSVARGSSMTFGAENHYDTYNSDGYNDGYGQDPYVESESYQGYHNGYTTDRTDYDRPSDSQASSAGMYNPNPSSNTGYDNQRQYSSTYANSPNIPPSRKKKQKSSHSAFSRFLASLLVIALCGLAGFGGATLAVKSTRSGYQQTTSNVNITGDVTSVNAASVIAEKVMPSVVGISTITQSQRETIFGLQSGTVQGIGTGIIVSEDGYILTNSHVVSDGNTQQITVDLYDGTEYSGKVLWNDSSLDLAIVKIDASGLSATDLGDSDNVNIGDYALAIGNPLGLNYERSVTSGIISGLNRSITTQDESTGKTNKMDGLIQTDAAINSGNSGGPLINSNGEVIGINTAKASSSEGLGFAIPINTAIPIIKQIKEKGSYEQTYIGISGVDLSTISQNYATDFNAKNGVFIMQIYTDSPAAAAGLKEGDIITEIDGKAVDGMSALKSTLINYVPGDTVELTIERDKSTQKVSLTLGSSEDATCTLQSNQNNSSNDSGSYGGSGYGYGGSGSGGFGGSGSGGWGGLFGQ